jgi:predicted nucleic acid-binding protein
MKYLLDSDIVSDLYEKESDGHPQIAAKLSSLEDSDVLAISILAIYEAEYGCAKADEEKRGLIRKRITAAQSDFEVLPLSPEGARLYGDIKRHLVAARGLDKKAGRIHNIDIMIAATAIAEDCTLVSGDGIFRDLQRFNRALRRENWFLDEAAGR